MNLIYRNLFNQFSDKMVKEILYFIIVFSFIIYMILQNWDFVSVFLYYKRLSHNYDTAPFLD